MALRRQGVGIMQSRDESELGAGFCKLVGKRLLVDPVTCSSFSRDICCDHNVGSHSVFRRACAEVGRPHAKSKNLAEAYSVHVFPRRLRAKGFVLSNSPIQPKKSATLPRGLAMADADREQIDMIDALIFVKRWRWRILLGASLGLLLAVGYTLQRGAVYTVRVPVSISDVKSDAAFSSARIIKTFQAALSSTADEKAAQLVNPKRPPFQLVPDGTPGGFLFTMQTPKVGDDAALKRAVTEFFDVLTNRYNSIRGREQTLDPVQAFRLRGIRALGDLGRLELELIQSGVRAGIQPSVLGAIGTGANSKEATDRAAMLLGVLRGAKSADSVEITAYEVRIARILEQAEGLAAGRALLRDLPYNRLPDFEIMGPITVEGQWKRDVGLAILGVLLGGAAGLFATAMAEFLRRNETRLREADHAAAR